MLLADRQYLNEEDMQEMRDLIPKNFSERRREKKKER